MLHFVEVSLGEGGTVACSRCRPSSDGPEYRPTAEVVDEITGIAEGWEAGPGPNVALTGAEPLGHPELPTLVASALQAGVCRLRLDTDAAGFASPTNAGGAVASGVLHVRFTLLGGTPGVHDVIAGRLGALDAMRAGVRGYRDAARAQDRAVHVAALLPVCRHTVRDLAVSAGLAVETGADALLLRVDDGGVDLRAATPWIVAACDTGVVNGVWAEVEGVPFCRLAGHELHVADVVRDRVGTHGPRCADCALRGMCAGGPPAAAADTLAGLAPPPDAEALAERIGRARAGVAR